MSGVSVVLPTHSRLPILRETVARVLAQELTGTTFELIVVDDHSSDATWDWLQAEAGTEPRLRPEHSPRRGRSAARNAGIAAAQGELVCFLDDDMWVLPGFLEAHWQAYRETGGTPTVCVGRMQPYPGNKPTLANLAYDRRLAHIDDCMAQYTDDLPCRYLCTGNVSMPRSLFEAGLAFDQEFGGYSFEDTELGYRLAADGVRFRYLAEASGEHRTDTTVNALLRKREEAGASAIRLLRQHPASADHLEVPFEVPGIPATSRQDGLGKRIAKVLLFSRPASCVLEGLLRLAAASQAERAALSLLAWAGYSRYGRAFRQAVAGASGGAGGRTVDS